MTHRYSQNSLFKKYKKKYIYFLNFFNHDSYKTFSKAMHVKHDICFAG